MSIKEQSTKTLKNSLKFLRNKIKNWKSLFFVYNEYGEKRNIFSISFFIIYNFIKKYIFRKKINITDEQVFFENSTKVKSFIAILNSIILSLVIIFIIKLTVPQKELYGEYFPTIEEQNSSNEVVNEETKKEESKEIQRISNLALDEEIAAQSFIKPISYSFNVDREITTKEKIHTFSSASWNAVSDILPENTKLKVNLLTSPNGYMMYKISGGDYNGKFITANPKLVSIESNNDNINTSFISKPIAIKFLVNSNNYTDASLTAIKNLIYANVVVNINGIGVTANNRIVYHISDGSFIPVDNTAIVETERVLPKVENPNTNNTTNSPNNTVVAGNARNSTKNNTTNTRNNNRTTNKNNQGNRR